MTFPEFVMVCEQRDGTWIATSDECPGLCAVASDPDVATEMLEELARVSLPDGAGHARGGIA